MIETTSLGLLSWFVSCYDICFCFCVFIHFQFKERRDVVLYGVMSTTTETVAVFIVVYMYIGRTVQAFITVTGWSGSYCC